MTALEDLFPLPLLGEMIDQGYVRRQTHPTLRLAILNYTENAAYEGVWNEVTRQCRGLIYETTMDARVVARPFPKFFNYGEPSAPELDLDAPAIVTEKLDGSLGILYPSGRNEWAIATRGSFASEQALHATDLLREHYLKDWRPLDGLTYLFEIIYPENRIVCDYGDRDELVAIDIIETSTGKSLRHAFTWNGPEVFIHPYATLADALRAEPRPGAEGLVVYLPHTDERVKIKQDDYVALHRILTGTNARHVWEYAAVRACRDIIESPKHWASYLGIDPARAAQLLEVGDGWLEAAGIPDEFYAWVRGIIDEAEEKAGQAALDGLLLAGEAGRIEDRRERFAFVHERAGAYEREVMRLATNGGDGARLALEQLKLRAWREATPPPTAPFARGEDVA